MANRKKPTARNRGGAKPGTPAGRPRNGSRPAKASKAAAVEPVLSTNPYRRRLERASAPLLLRLHYAPRWFLSAVMISLLLLGLFVPGPLAALFLVIVALLLIWLLALGWPALSRGSRVGRILIIAMVLISALIRAAGLHVPAH